MNINAEEEKGESKWVKDKYWGGKKYSWDIYSVPSTSLLCINLIHLRTLRNMYYDPNFRGEFAETHGG